MASFYCFYSVSEKQATQTIQAAQRIGFSKRQLRIVVLIV